MTPHPSNGSGDKGNGETVTALDQQLAAALVNQFGEAMHSQERSAEVIAAAFKVRVATATRELRDVIAYNTSYI